MNTVKKEVIDMIKKLPEEADYDQIMAEIYFKQRVDKSLQQIRQGKTLSHAKAKERLSKWIK